MQNNTYLETPARTLVCTIKNYFRKPPLLPYYFSRDLWHVPSIRFVKWLHLLSLLCQNCFIHKSLECHRCDNYLWLHYDHANNSAFCHLCMRAVSEGKLWQVPNVTLHLLAADIRTGKKPPLPLRDINSVCMPQRSQRSSCHATPADSW